MVEAPRAEHEPARMFTTEKMIELERDNIQLMRAGQNQHAPLAHEIGREHEHLSNSQRTAVEEILASRDQVTALEGAAGTGKTTSLAAIREAAEREGYTVKGFAPTSRAAQKLEEAGIESGTLQKYLQRGEHEQSGEKHLYVLDESSLASTKQMNEFFHRLNEHDRVLLVGDVRQHEAVEAGRPYQQLQDAGMQTSRLEEIVRQKDPALKEAVEQLARGDVKEAIDNLDSQGRVHQIEDRDERLTAIATEYARQPEGTLVISPDNESRRALNELIHAEMQERGAVGQGEHKVEGAGGAAGDDRRRPGMGHAVRGRRHRALCQGQQDAGHRGGRIRTSNRRGQKTKSDHGGARQRRRGHVRSAPLAGCDHLPGDRARLSEGDRVQFTAPSKELHVANRQLGTIERITDEGDLAIRTDSGRNVRSISASIRISITVMP